MKKFKSIFLSSLLVCGLCACGNQNSNQGNQSSQSDKAIDEKAQVSYHTPEAIKNRGEILVGIHSGEYEYFKNEDGTEGGYEYEISKAIASSIDENLKVTFVDSDVDEMLDSLEKGEIDIALASLEATPELKERFTLSKSYWPWEMSALSVLVKDENKDAYSELSNFSGKKFAVLTGTMDGDMVRESLSDAEIVECQDAAECITKLENGEVDAIAGEISNFEESIKSKTNIYQTSITVPENIEDKGLFVAIMKENNELKSAVDSAIETNKENGNIENWVMEAWKKMLEAYSKAMEAENHEGHDHSHNESVTEENTSGDSQAPAEGDSK